MATFTTPSQSLYMKSTWSCYYENVLKAWKMTTRTTQTSSVTFDFSSIPAGSTINSATMYATIASSPYTGAAVRSVNDGTERSFNIAGQAVSIAAGTTKSYEFKFRANGEQHTATANHTSAFTYTDLRIVVDYTLPYTAVTAPTAVSVSPTSVGPSGGATLSWSGATDGTNNALTRFHVYYNDGGGWAAYQTDIYGWASTVWARADNGGVRYFQVQSIGTVEGYHSGISSASAALTSQWSAPGAPTSISISASHVSGGNLTFSWSGASNGTNNPIAYYLVQRYASDNQTWVDYSTTTGTSMTVPSGPAGGYVHYRVASIGTVSGSNSGFTSYTTTYTYTNPSAPTNVRLDQTVIDASTTTTLRWNAQAAGYDNAITSYIVYRRLNGSGDYAAWSGSHVTGTTLAVTAPGTMGHYYDYIVYTVGTYSWSTNSSSVRLTAKTYTAVNPPTNISVNTPYTNDATVVLSWSGATGGTNTSVVSYHIYRNGVHAYSTAQNSYTVPSSETVGGSSTYTVYSISSPQGYNSVASAAVTVYRYGTPSAPSSVTLNNASGTLYIGSINKPTVTLSWSGAGAGTYGAISGYDIYHNGTFLKTVSTTNTYGSTTITDVGAYTVRTKASGGTTGDSSSATLTEIAKPVFQGFTTSPTGEKNGSVSFVWNQTTAPTGASSITYHVGYKNNTDNLIYITSVSSSSYDLNINNYITQGNNYYLGVLVQANASGGGHTEAIQGYTLSTSDTWRAAAPASPVIVANGIKDKDGNTSYAQNQTSISFTYTKPTRGANVSKYVVYYKYGSTGSWTKLGDFASSPATHNTSQVAAGTQLYYRVEVVDIYGFTAFIDSSSYIMKLYSPTISGMSIALGSAPNTTATVTFTPGNGSISRNLKYQVRLLYGSEAVVVKSYTQIAQGSAGSPLTTPSLTVSIPQLKSALTELFQEVITNAKPNPTITVEITLADDQQTPVVDNYVVATFTKVFDYSTKPTITGSIIFSNKTATSNGKSISYVNSGDILLETLSGLTISWVNADGSTTGKALTYELSGPIMLQSPDVLPTSVEKTMGVFQTDGTYSSTLTVTQNYTNGVKTYANSQAATYSYKRFVVPSVLMSLAERSNATTYKARLDINDNFTGGSSTVKNVSAISNFVITDGTTSNPITATINSSNKTLINSVAVPQTITNLTTTTIIDTSITATATLTLSSGRTIPITSAVVLLKAFGVSFAVRKNRAGINVEPTTFLASMTEPTFTVVAPPNSTVSNLLMLENSVTSTGGTGIHFSDTYDNIKTDGRIYFKNNLFYLNKALSGTEFIGQLTGNATSANKVNNKLTLGEQTFDGSAAVTVNIGNATGYVPISNGVLNVNLNADLLDGLHATAFSAAVHSHVKANITDFPSSMPASDVYTWAKAATKPSYTYSEVGAAAASHNHIYLNHPDDDRSSATPYPNSVARSLRTCFKTGSVLGGTIGNYIGVINFAPWDGDSASTGDCSYQLAFGGTAPNGGNPRLAIRNGINTTWNAWNEIVTSTNVGSYAVLPRSRSNWNDSTVINNVVGMLAWKNYGNGHTIFDASAGTSPDGGAVDRTNSQNAWASTYPTLMGWNGANTYGVRVDRARRVDIDGVYPVGAIYMSVVATSPATLFGGTWSALPTGRFLRTGTGGATGGSDTHAHSTAAMALTQAQLPNIPVIPYGVVPYIYGGSFNGYNSTVGFAAMNPASTGTVNFDIAGRLGSGHTHEHGNTGSASNVPAYYEVYAWRRTA